MSAEKKLRRAIEGLRRQAYEAGMVQGAKTVSGMFGTTVDLGFSVDDEGECAARVSEAIDELKAQACGTGSSTAALEDALSPQ